VSAGNFLLCEHCGEMPATCIGAYDNDTDMRRACDVCCGHGCEDGHCDELGQAEAVRELIPFDSVQG